MSLDSKVGDTEQQEIDTRFYNLLQSFRRDLFLLEAKELMETFLAIKNLYSRLSNKVRETYLFDNMNTYHEIRVFFPEEKKEEKKKTVTLVSYELTRTGAPTVLKDLAALLMEKGYEVYIVSTADGPLREEYVCMGCTVIIQDTLGVGVYSEECIEENKFVFLDALLEYSEFAVFNTLVLHKVLRHYSGYKKKIYWWLHEGDVTFNACRPYLMKEISDNIQIVSGYQYVDIRVKECFGNQYSGTILSYMVPDFERKNEKKNDREKLRFICAGTIDSRKGQDLLVEAIKGLPFEYLKKTEFIFVGAKNDKHIVRQLEAMNSHYSNVFVYSPMKRDEIISLYEDVDCALIPSRDDPMPVVATENMILGNTVLCSTATGTASYITDGENGFVFESESVEALIKKIMYMVDHMEIISDVGEKSRKIYDDNFSKMYFEKEVEKIMLH